MFTCKEEVLIIANSSSGSCFIERQRDKKIFYVSSEGELVYISKKIDKLVELIIQFSYWMDMIRFSNKVEYSSYFKVHQDLTEERIEFLPEFIEIQSEYVKLFNVPSKEIVLKKFIEVIKSGTDLSNYFN